MNYLLDTMVVSEPIKARPMSAVVNWMATEGREGAAISAITLGEVAFGVARMPEGKRRTELEVWFGATFVSGPLAEAILPVDAAVAQRWAALRAGAGRTLPLADGLIAATALVHGLKLVTRNRRDFAPLDVQIFDPWAGP